MSIFSEFPITNEEYEKLEKNFGQLCNYESWQLLRKNTRNNHTDDYDDIAQNLRISMIHAGCYYKRQIYIDACFVIANKYVKDKILIFILQKLENLWHNKTRHGANRQKFGKHQEEILETIVGRYVPNQYMPRKNESLKIDKKFTTYCKAVTWNRQKTMGKKITKEKNIRSRMTSLSEFDYLGSL